MLTLLSLNIIILILAMNSKRECFAMYGVLKHDVKARGLGRGSGINAIMNDVKCDIATCKLTCL